MEECKISALWNIRQDHYNKYKKDNSLEHFPNNTEKLEEDGFVGFVGIRII